MFGYVSDKGRLLIIESDDTRFLTGIGGTVTKDDFCAGVAIKCSIHHSRLNSVYAI